MTLLEIFDDVSVKPLEEDCWGTLKKCTAFRALEELWNSVVINKHSQIVFIVCCSLFLSG
jgi:hypothetical protein